MQTANSGADASPKKTKLGLMDGEKKEPVVGVSFEVYQSEAATFQGIGEFRKAINSYTRVSVYFCIWPIYTGWDKIN